MPAVSDEELEQLREENQKLRERIATAQTKKAENDADRQLEYEALQLAAENKRLEAELAAAEFGAKASTSQEGAANVLDAAAKQLEDAVLQSSQTPGPVDTNAENQPKDTTGATVATVAPEEKSSGSSTSYPTSSNGGN